MGDSRFRSVFLLGEGREGGMMKGGGRDVSDERETGNRESGNTRRCAGFNG